jgi:hypothetical protein
MKTFWSVDLVHETVLQGAMLSRIINFTDQIARTWTSFKLNYALDIE